MKLLLLLLLTFSFHTVHAYTPWNCDMSKVTTFQTNLSYDTSAAKVVRASLSYMQTAAKTAGFSYSMTGTGTIRGLIAGSNTTTECGYELYDSVSIVVQTPSGKVPAPLTMLSVFQALQARIDTYVASSKIVGTSFQTGWWFTPSATPAIKVSSYTSGGKKYVTVTIDAENPAITSMKYDW